MLPLLITLQNVFFDATDRFKKDEKGATAVEYGLLVGLIAVAIVATIALLGPQLKTLFDTVLTALGGTPPA